MKNLEIQISKNLKEGYKLVNCVEHKSSQYFYINNRMGVELKARISDHETMAGRSASHVNILSNRFLHLDFDFEIQFDEDDYEIELTEEEARKQLTSHFGIEISETQVEEFDNISVKLDNLELKWEDQESIIGIYIAEKIMEVENVSLTF